jgi:hypothetical protein
VDLNSDYKMAVPVLPLAAFRGTKVPVGSPESIIAPSFPESVTESL